jgi:two-component system, sensor histidine kinase and response regulator
MYDLIGRYWRSKALPAMPRCMAVVASAIAGMAVAGWVLDIEVLTRIGPGLTTMKPNTAVAFLLASASLWTLQGNARARRLSLGLAAGVLLIGGLTLFEDASGISLGIDEILAHEPAGAVGSLAPNRMHPMTALNFVLLASALAILGTCRWYWTGQGFALLAGLIGATALISYFYGVRQFVGLAAFYQMAVHSSVGMLVLAAGILLARPDRGLMATITVDSAGGLMARRLLPVALIVPVTLNGLTLLAEHNRVFDVRFGAAFCVSMVVGVFFAFIGQAANLLHQIDMERRLISEGLRSAHRELEARIGVQAAVEAELRASEKQYKLAEETLRTAGEHLEQRVHVRTAELALANEDLQRGKLRYRLLVEATTAIVWNTSPDGEFAAEQPGWSAFTGQSPDEYKGRGRFEAIHPDDRPGAVQAWSTALASQSIYHCEHRLRRHDGEYRHMVERALPIPSEDGTICEWVGIDTDVDEQVRAKEAMRAGKEAAEAATRAKSEFLANMSHEIRTPMNGIIGMTELALDTDLTAEQREFLDLVKSSADAMLIVINDILDFSKIEAGKLDLDPVKFNLRGAVEGTLKILALRAHDKGLELSGRFAPDVPNDVLGDSGRLQQILVNLVGNAIKFTERGEVVVTVVTMAPGTDGEELTLHLMVSDTGIGIAPDKLHAILEPFTQADGSTTRKYGGTGLGLAISCKLAELMGGRLWVESEPGRGSTFHFTVKLKPQPAMPADPGKADQKQLRDLPILIVDDNQTNRRILDEVVANWGGRPTSVDSGPAALTALAAATAAGRPFAVVLLDGLMPGMDGLDVAERITADPTLAGTLVVLLTSCDRRASASGRSPNHSIAARLTKPVRQSELLGLLVKLLTSGSDHASPVPRATPATPSGRQLKILLAGDNCPNRQVVMKMLTRRGHDVTVAGDGRQALDAQAETAHDLILMDVQMPGMNAFETLAAIRFDERSTGRHLPVIALTQDAVEEDKERCLARGFDACLSKPIQPLLMLTTIDELGAGPRH